MRPFFDTRLLKLALLSRVCFCCLCIIKSPNESKKAVEDGDLHSKGNGSISESEDIIECRSELSYSVKLTNPGRKSEFQIEKWRTNVKFKTPTHLESKLKEHFSELNECKHFCMGYIEPGHGWKGKQRWITDGEDLLDMYRVYESRKEILLWCFLQCQYKA